MGRAQKNLAHKLAAGIIDVGGNVIKRFTGDVEVQKMRGERYDRERQEILRRRESRMNDKAMGY